jgi:hypothetical protein
MRNLGNRWRTNAEEKKKGKKRKRKEKRREKSKSYDGAMRVAVKC